MTSWAWIALLAAGAVACAGFVGVLVIRLQHRISRYDEQALAPESETDLRARVTTEGEP